MSDVKLWDEAPNLWDEEPDDNRVVEDETCGSETDNTMLYELIAEQLRGLADLFHKLAEIAKVKESLDKLPPVNPQPCEYAINKQAVIDGINRYFHDEYYQRTSIQDCRDCLIEDVIKPLPPVTPQPQQKIGHWIPKQEIIGVDKEGNEMSATVGYKCSKCLIIHSHTSLFCPSCGAKMIESQAETE